MLPLLYHQYSKIDLSTQGMSPHRIIVNSALVELRNLYFHLCENHRLLVRREAARNLGSCVKVFGSSCYPRCLSQLQAFLHDDVFLGNRLWFIGFNSPCCSSFPSYLLQGLSKWFWKESDCFILLTKSSVEGISCLIEDYFIMIDSRRGSEGIAEDGRSDFNTGFLFLCLRWCY